MKKILEILMCLLLISGCSGGKKSEDYYEPGINPAPSNYAPDYEKDGGYDTGEPGEEKLVYTGSVFLETKDYDKTSAELTDLTRQYKAVTQSTDESSGGSGRRTLYLVLRVPAEHFDDFLNALRSSSGSVQEISTNVDNITEAYNNNELEIAALNTQHARLLELLETASTLEDIILLEQRLSEVELRLTKLNQYKNHMDADVRYSTITLTLREVQTYSETSFVQRLGNAFSGSWSTFLDNTESFIVWLIYALPLIVILVILALVLRKPVTNLWRKRKNKKEPTKDTE